MKRFTAMSVPTDSGALWFLYDRERMRSVCECEDMEAAFECAKLANAAEASL